MMKTIRIPFRHFALKESVKALFFCSLIVPSIAIANSEGFLDDISKMEVKQSPLNQEMGETKTYQSNPQLTADAAQQKLEEITRKLSDQIATLKQQQLNGKNTVNALREQNTELTTAAAAAQKTLDDTIRHFSAQIASLQQQSHGEHTRVLNQKNDEASIVLIAEIASLKQQNAQLQAGEKETVTALNQKNADLTAAATAEQKKQNESITKLNEESKKLQATINSLSLDDKKINIKDTTDRNSYALGVFYLNQALFEANKMVSNNIKINPDSLALGFSDAYRNKLKINMDEIETIVTNLNEQFTSKVRVVEDKLKDKIKNKNAEMLSNGSYFVVDKKGKGKYSQGDIISFNIYEKHLDGKPILNTMNSSIMNNNETDPFMKKIIGIGKGGIVTIYGKVENLYDEKPPEIKANEIISLTFELHP